MISSICGIGIWTPILLLNKRMVLSDSCHREIPVSISKEMKHAGNYYRASCFEGVPRDGL